MNAVLAFAREEWRLWIRSKLALSALLIGLILLVCSTILTAVQMFHDGHERAHLQASSEQAFLEQPDRHPHRMVHYGHYVFRLSPPLSVIDPGLDAYTGTSIFLEGHRQNTAMFADRQAGASLASFGALSPVLLLQLLAPLILILLGFNSITRERKSATYYQLLALGVSPLQIMAGKGLALLGVAGVILLPVAIALLIAVIKGEPLLTAMVFLIGCAFYLMIWCLLILLVSQISRSRHGSISLLICCWLLLGLILPPVAASYAAQRLDTPGKIASDFALLEATKKKGDGHNAADPAFAALKAKMLAQYNVSSIEELPVNFRGVVAQYAEAELTDLLNQFAEQRMAAELQQAELARGFGWLSPVMSIREFSMIVAGVDLASHHRFLREAEAVRFDFVQSLNRAHETQMAYADDIRRSSDPEAEQRTRVSAENWQVLDEYEFKADPPSIRESNSSFAMIKLFVWCVALACLCYVVGRREAP